MFYDLSVSWPLSPAPVSSLPKKARGKPADVPPEKPVMRIEDRHTLEKTLELAGHLGYGVIAYNLMLPPDCFDPVTLRVYNPCADGRPLLPERDPRFSRSTGRGEPGLLQLSRLTVTYDESCISGHGNGKCFVSGNANLLADFDLLSVLPLDAAAFTHACLNLSGPTATGVDIITLDLASSAKLPFHFKRSTVLKAVSEGVVFEVAYGVAMRSSASRFPIPKDARRNVMAGARELIRVTGGKGVILSGNVATCMELRAPLDLINLGGLLGFKPDQARASVSATCKAIVMRAHSNRKGYRGTISPPLVLVDNKDLRKRRREEADDLDGVLTQPPGQRRKNV